MSVVFFQTTMDVLVILTVTHHRAGNAFFVGTLRVDKHDPLVSMASQSNDVRHLIRTTKESVAADIHMLLGRGEVAWLKSLHEKFRRPQGRTGNLHVLSCLAIQLAIFPLFIPADIAASNDRKAKSVGDFFQKGSLPSVGGTED